MSASGDQIELKLREWGDGFMDVPESERQFQAEIAESISEDMRIKELSKALNDLVRARWRIILDFFVKMFSEFSSGSGWASACARRL